MNTRFTLAAAIGAFLSFGAVAFGQQDGGYEFRKWDAAATIGILGSSGRDFVRSTNSYSETSFAWNFDAGRYLTTHLKADAGLMLTSDRSTYDWKQDSQGRSITYSRGKVHSTSVSGALTYQFLENAWAHPFVSAGVRAMSLSEERETFNFLNNQMSPPTVRSTERYMQLRPFAAAGFKSYFNERAFMKSELLFAADSRGISHGTLRVGFGFDF